MRFLIRCVSLVLVCTVAAQARPAHWYKDCKWWAGEGAIAAALVLDAHSTCRGMGAGNVESSPLAFGSRSCGSAAGVSAGAFAFYTTMHAVEWHVGHDDPARPMRTLTPWMVPAIVVAIHGIAAYRNYGLAPQAAPAQTANPAAGR